jgi:hypothetical protein
MQARDGTIKLHGTEGFDGMRKAGRLAAEILDCHLDCVDHVWAANGGINTRHIDNGTNAKRFDVLRRGKIRQGACAQYARSNESRKNRFFKIH